MQTIRYVSMNEYPWGAFVSKLKSMGHKSKEQLNIYSLLAICVGSS